MYTAHIIPCHPFTLSQLVGRHAVGEVLFVDQDSKSIPVQRSRTSVAPDAGVPSRLDDLPEEIELECRVNTTRAVFEYSRTS